MTDSIDSSGVPADSRAPAMTPAGADGAPPAGTRPQDALAIEAKGLSKRFGKEVVAVDHVDLSVKRGEIFGLVGPDGAGKSTLIRMLSTVLGPSEGDAFVFGNSVVKRAADVKPLIGYMSQRFSLYPDLTARENLVFFAKLRGVPADEIEERVERSLEFSALTEFSTRQADHLSGGMKQKLSLAVTLLHDPELLFLDEPTTGVDPVSRREFWRIISALHQRDITVLVATPYMDEAELCSTVAFMDDGRIAFLDSPAGLKARVPGRLVEIETDRERDALAAISCMDGVVSATVQGDLVRALIAPAGPSHDALRQAVSHAGVTVHSVADGRIDMEATFAYLAEDAAGAREVDAGDAVSSGDDPDEVVEE